MNQTNDAFEKALEAAAAVKKTVDDFLPTAVKTLDRIVKQVEESVSRINYDQISKIFDTLGSLIETITNPQITTQEKERLLISYKSWGSYGWAMPINAPVDLFDNPPSTRTDANKIAMEFCKKDDVDAIFAELETKKHVRKSDLLEAKFCFDNRKYKSCVMMLFSMIDARLIRLVGKEKGEKQRPSGLLAAKRLIKHVKGNYSEAQRLLFILRLENLEACYAVIFAKGSDFKTQVEVINRNFVDHGMLWKTVTRTDCIQVLLLFYETILLLEQLNVKKMPNP